MVATAILLYFWFDLPNGVIAARVFGPDIKADVSGWKVWSALLAVLTYLSLRHWSALSKSDDWKLMCRTFADRRHKSITEAIKRLTKLGSRRHRGIRVLFKNLRATELAVHSNQVVDTRSLKFSSFHAANTSRWEGTMTLVTGDEPTLVPFSAFEDFEFSRLFRWTFEIRALLNVVSSKYFAEILVPIAITYLAATFCMYSLSKSIFAVAP